MVLQGADNIRFHLRILGHSFGGGRWSSEREYQLNLIDMVCLQYTFNHPSKTINPTVPFLGVEDNVLWINHKPAHSSFSYLYSLTHLTIQAKLLDVFFSGLTWRPCWRICVTSRNVAVHAIRVAGWVAWYQRCRPHVTANGPPLEKAAWRW